jgi:pyruvate dehydrogenase E2 component (dihydrolipoamide acetyltransferase)
VRQPSSANGRFNSSSIRDNAQAILSTTTRRLDFDAAIGTPFIMWLARITPKSQEDAMPTDIVMPQMGESIFEGTITKWLKKPGDKVQRDEPLFEISTDKVDAEIPAPSSGVLKEIKVEEGATVQVNTVVGVIDEAGSATGAAVGPAKESSAKTAGATKGRVDADAGSAKQAPSSPASVAQAEGSSGAQPQPTEVAARAATAAAKATASEDKGEHEVIEFPAEGGERVRSSPLVRKIAKEHNVDLAQVTGSGLAGRITKDDVLGYIQHGGKAQPARPAAAAGAAPQVAASPRPAPVAAAAPAVLPGEIVPMSPMRKKIAERMVESKRTSPHVHTVYEVDMTRVAQIRQAKKNSWEQRNGIKLTFMPFIARATIAAIRQFPIVNSSVEGDSIHYHSNINLGIAVALDWGLIVPVVRNAEEKNFLGLQRAINDLGERARNKRLTPDEVQGGTFTITNPGSIGGLFGLPIIMQPQVAILGIGGIKKEAVVLTDDTGVDSIAIRSMMHIVLGYDHRIIDGAVAGQFLGAMKKFLETWSEDIG